MRIVYGSSKQMSTYEAIEAILPWHLRRTPGREPTKDRVCICDGTACLLGLAQIRGLTEFRTNELSRRAVVATWSASRPTSKGPDRSFISTTNSLLGTARRPLLERLLCGPLARRGVQCVAHAVAQNDKSV